MAHLLDMMVIVVLAAIWAFLPNDGLALVAQWFYNKVVQVSIHIVLVNLKSFLPAEKKNVGGIRHEARNCGRSSPDTLAFFEPAKRPDDRADYCLDSSGPGWNGSGKYR